MEVKYENVKPAVTFTHIGFGDLPQTLKEGSVDVVIFSSEGLIDEQRASLMKGISRVLKLGGKALSSGLADNPTTE